MSAKQVKVYTPDGAMELHTLPNARDLINIGYTWQPKQPTTPAALSPYRVDPTANAFKKPASQEVFDRFGGSTTDENSAPVAAETPDEDLPVEEVVEEIVVVEVPDEAPASESVVETPVELPRAPRKRFEKKD